MVTCQEIKRKPVLVLVLVLVRARGSAG